MMKEAASETRKRMAAATSCASPKRPSGIDETLGPGLSAEAAATALARAKARDVADRAHAAGEESALILGADTLVVLDGRLLGKPASRDEARAMLRALRGRRHDVVSVRPSGQGVDGDRSLSILRCSRR